MRLSVLGIWRVETLCFLLEASLADCTIAQCQLSKVVPPTAEQGNIFGWSVSISGTTGLIGEPYYDEFTTYYGAAYVIKRQGSAWIIEQELTAQDADFEDGFGRAVSIDGDVLVVSAPLNDDAGPQSGSVYVFRYNGSTWFQEQKLTAADSVAGDGLGSSVAISGDLVLCGAEGAGESGAAYIFRYHGGTWFQEDKFVGTIGYGFGGSVSVANNVAIVGAWGADTGMVHVFRYTAPFWAQEARLVPSDASSSVGFGYSVSLDGSLLVIGAPGSDDACAEVPFCNSGSAYIFRQDGTTWYQEQKIIASDANAGAAFGFSVATSGDTIIVGASFDGLSDHGAAYIFRFDGATWIETSKITPTDASSFDFFGNSTTCSGSLAVIGARGDSSIGSAYIFGVAGDCNENNMVDICDIRDGTSQDENDDLFPDECVPIYGDIFPQIGDRSIDVGDVLCCLDGFSDELLCPDADIIPCNGDGNIDVGDILAVLDAFAGIYACVWNNGMWVPN